MLTKTTTQLCSHFNECGGCRFQDVPYEDQLEYKSQVLFNLFKDNDLGQIDIPDLIGGFIFVMD